ASPASGKISAYYTGKAAEGPAAAIGPGKQTKKTAPQRRLSGPARELIQCQQFQLLFAGGFQELTAATRHAGKRVVGNNHRQAGFFAQQLVEITQQRTAAGQYHTALGDVRRQFRR